MKEDVSVILPTYNEAGNIARLVVSIDKLFAPFEIIVIDDQSNDGTIDELKRIKKQIKCLKVHINKQRLGLTKSIKKGIATSSGKIVAWMDADFSQPPMTLNKMYQKIKKYDFIIGSWLCSGGKDARKEKLDIIRSFLINKICQIFLRDGITAYTSGFAMARKKIFNAYEMPGDYGEYFIDLVHFVRGKKYRICEVPFTCVSRTVGLSKTNPNLFILAKRTFQYLGMTVRTSINQ